MLHARGPCIQRAQTSATAGARWRISGLVDHACSRRRRDGSLMPNAASLLATANGMPISATADGMPTHVYRQAWGSSGPASTRAVRWLSDGCPMAVRWLSDGCPLQMREDNLHAHGHMLSGT